MSSALMRDGAAPELADVITQTLFYIAGLGSFPSMKSGLPATISADQKAIHSSNFSPFLA
jgi:hypothetical protein